MNIVVVVVAAAAAVAVVAVAVAVAVIASVQCFNRLNEPKSTTSAGRSFMIQRQLLVRQRNVPSTTTAFMSWRLS